MSNSTRKIKKFIQGIGLLLKNPGLLNELIDKEDLHVQAVQKLTVSETGLPEVDFFSLTPENFPVIEPYAFLDGGSLPTDIALLKGLAEKFKARSYFEIGTWRGESVANLSKIVDSCITLDLGAEEMRKRKWKEEYIKMHGYFLENRSNILQLYGDSRTFDFSPYYGKQDIVFIDGDHHYDTVLQDTRNAFRLLKDENSIIVWHDYAHQPENVRWNVAHAILEGTPPEKRSSLYAVSHTLCAAYLPFEIETRERVFPENPHPWFSVRLEKKTS